LRIVHDDVEMIDRRREPVDRQALFDAVLVDEHIPVGRLIAIPRPENPDVLVIHIRAQDRPQNLVEYLEPLASAEVGLDLALFGRASVRVNDAIGGFHHNPLVWSPAASRRITSKWRWRSGRGSVAPAALL